MVSAIHWHIFIFYFSLFVIQKKNKNYERYIAQSYNTH
jgi:hypothetical protein